MRPEALAYQDLIESLADGHQLDWGALEAQARTEVERRKYRNLRLVARVAELHRTLSVEEAVEPALPLEKQPAPERPATWGHLQITRRLAAGAFGELYVAHDPQLDRDVALKLLRAEASARPLTQRLLSEAQTLARVRHTNVVDVHGADVRDGRAGLWMELIDGQTLDAWIREHGPMGAGEATAIGRDLCHALAAVHAAGLVHSDLKPQNVMREKGGRTVLMDFGAGRAQGSAVPVSGTPMYFAPEVLAGGPPDARSDIYSLGVLLFHLLTSRYPTPAADLPSLRQAHAEGTRVYLRDIRADLPQPLVDSVEQALEADPAMRYQSAGAMERALAGAEARPKPRPWLGFVAVTAAVVIAALLALTMPRFGAPTQIRSVGVIPFPAPSEDVAHLFNGLSEDVVRQLQRFDIAVKRGPASANALPVSELERRIGTDAILRATAMDGDPGPRLRVSVQRAGGSEIFHREYAVDASTLPGLAGTIVNEIMAELGVAMRQGSIATEPHQPNARAYDAYQRGKLYAERRNEASLKLALEHFKQAADLDSQYAEPHAGMADAYAALGVPPIGALRPMEARRLATNAARQALRRNPELAEAHTSQAWVSVLYDWDWESADDSFKKAIALNGQYARAHHWYAMFLTDMGRFDEARAELKKAADLEPLSLLLVRDFGWISFLEGEFDQAIRELGDTLSRDPNYAFAGSLLARALAEAKRFPEAFKELERVKGDIGTANYLSFRGYFEALSGDTAAARRTLAELGRLAQSTFVTRYYFALVHTALGDTSQALSELERARDEQDATLGSVNVDPRFARLRKEPRFQALIASMNFPDARR